MDFLRGFLGLFLLTVIAWACSTNRKKVDWALVGKLLVLQFVLAVLLIKVPLIAEGLKGLAGFFNKTLDFTKAGSGLLLGDLVNKPDSYGTILLFQVLPTVIFFAALTSVLYYLRILQVIVFAFAWLMKKTVHISGAESLAAAANVFVGQTEAPLVVKPYVSKMTRSELMCLMTGGFATIAGGVFVVYMSVLGGGDAAEQIRFGLHLITASVISAPAAVMAAKILIPEQEPIDVELKFPREKMGESLLDAITGGTAQGVKLFINIAAMLLVFTAFVAMFNYIFEAGFGEWTGLNKVIESSSGGRYTGLTLQYLLGLCMAPVAWIVGVPNGDLMAVGQLLGEKTILNEFVAYFSMADMRANGLLQNEKSVIIATYALCGFANLASVGIQIGGIGAIAPDRRLDLCRLGIRALIGGTLACLYTACLAGMLV